PAPIARHQRSSTQLTSLLINNAGALAERLSFTLGAQSLATAVAKDCHVRTEVPVSRVARKQDGRVCLINGVSGVFG
ncbi:hypothetical protein OSH39_25345, partial [Mycobacterium ulcerans]|nr:hypothetical protein [Mycobacterium ulcerans]MEB3911389.1 hypothetical protein [Mycobacterium ulcerans]MEB3921627.1 hypothetical protein [Mycobacterium ulcerans]MEB3925758.1 hypothetical protein [Mycobacterium ulcerans]MEB3929885.1 hypothetical protein [Mycobacterium ulcerans]